MKISYNSPTILTFALLCTAIYFLSSYIDQTVMQYFMVSNQLDLSPRGIFSLFSHTMGHGSLEHLLGNMTFILLLGPIVEEKYGSLKTALMILATALLTGMINVLFFDTALLGASGIVFMLIILVSITNAKSKTIPLTFILVAILFIGKEIIQAMGTDQVSQAAHIIGGLCGSIFGFASKPNRSA